MQKFEGLDFEDRYTKRVVALFGFLVRVEKLYYRVRKWFLRMHGAMHMRLKNAVDSRYRNKYVIFRSNIIHPDRRELVYVGEVQWAEVGFFHHVETHGRHSEVQNDHHIGVGSEFIGPTVILGIRPVGVLMNADEASQSNYGNKKLMRFQDLVHPKANKKNYKKDEVHYSNASYVERVNLKDVIVVYGDFFVTEKQAKEMTA